MKERLSKDNSQSISEEPNKRYPLVVSRNIWEGLLDVSDTQKSSILSILKRYIRFGLFITKHVRPNQPFHIISGGTRVELSYNFDTEKNLSSNQSSPKPPLQK